MGILRTIGDTKDYRLQRDTKNYRGILRTTEGYYGLQRDTEEYRL